MGSIKSMTTVLKKYSNQGVGRASRVPLPCLTVILTAVAVTHSAFAFDNSAPTAPSIIRTVSPFTAKVTYPIKVSANNRYLIDQNDVPFLMVGDAPQMLIANVSQAEAGAYMANRRSYGINTLWINLLCNFSDGCNKDATTFAGSRAQIQATSM